MLLVLDDMNTALASGVGWGRGWWKGSCGGWGWGRRDEGIEEGFVATYSGGRNIREWMNDCCADWQITVWKWAMETAVKWI